ALAPGGVDADGRLAGQIADVHVAGRDVSPGRGHADLRPVEVLVPEPDRPEHGARGGLPGAVHHDSRVRARINALFHSWTLVFMHWPFSGIGERALHPLEAEGAGGRHGER